MLLGYPKAKFGPLTRKQPQSLGNNHFKLSNLIYNILDLLTLLRLGFLRVVYSKVNVPLPPPSPHHPPLYFKKNLSNIGITLETC